jgi:hypothetical protein
MRKIDLIKNGYLSVPGTSDGDYFHGMSAGELYATVHQERPLPLQLTIVVDLTKNRSTKNSAAKERFHDFLDVKEQLSVMSFESGKLASILTTVISVNKLEFVRLKLILRNRR